MNADLLTPKSRACLEAGCYLLKEADWVHIAHTISTLESLSKLAMSGPPNGGLAMSAVQFSDLVMFMAITLGAAEKALVWQPPCALNQPTTGGAQ